MIEVLNIMIQILMLIGGNLLNGIEPILSEKDKSSPLLKDSDCNFVYKDSK